jgi:anhydro-N-acetylmuramic acid kinase
MSEYYIGLMSGTSADGIDAALVDFSNRKFQLVAFEYIPFSVELKNRIHQLIEADSIVSLKNYGALDTLLGKLFARACLNLLAKTNISASDIRAIGSHGQTIYHSPSGIHPFSLQIGDPNIIAEVTGITTVADFRRRDIAANGHGAPLVPAFHKAVFADCKENRCIVNIGGIANITVLPANASESVTGFDTGMGNTLMDQWILKHQGLSFDNNGLWGRTGEIDFELVEQLKQDAFFHTLPPKSTGKEYFSSTWLEQNCNAENYKPADIQASLCLLTAVTICDAIKKFAPATERVLICGGGVHNSYLMQLIQQLLPCSVESTENYGIHPDHVEAMAFAWLARQTVNGLTGNLREVTGANNPVILGGIYPALTA